MDLVSNKNFKNKKIVVGIPVYNEEQTIAKIIILSQKYADAVIVCDDGSTDLSAEIARRLGSIVIKHEKNKGKGAAIRCLFQKARNMDADILVTLDGDGQHNPDDIPRLIEPILNGDADITIGSRFANKNESNEVPHYRRIGNKILNMLTNIGLKRKIKDSQSGFRAYNKRALHAIEIITNGMGVDSQILLDSAKKGLNIIEVPVSIKYKGLKTSKKNPFIHAIDVIVSIVSYTSHKRPLLYFGVPGFIFVIIGLGLGMYSIYIFNTLRVFDVLLVLLASFFLLSGAYLSMTAIILNAISRLKKSE
ncbi:MAG: glycosyltransferase family 2 protein [Candidatus Asgardarchaeia archaeon]